MDKPHTWFWASILWKKSAAYTWTFTVLVALHAPAGIQIRKERLKVKEFNIPFSKNGCMVQNLSGKICNTLIASKTIILDISVCSLPFTMKKFSINNEIVYWKIGSFACMYAVLSISFEVDVPTGKVGGSLLFERQKRELPRGVWGHVPPENFQNLGAWECYFHRFPDSIWALRTIKIKYVYYNRSFPQNLNHLRIEWLDKSSNANAKNTLTCKVKLSF